MKTNFTHGWKRLFVAVAVVHLLLSCVMLIVAIGGAVGAHEGEPLPGDAAVGTVMDLLAAPIVLARMLLPESMAPGFGPLELLINSLVWRPPWWEPSSSGGGGDPGPADDVKGTCCVLPSSVVT